jgi:hypothetical protein
MIAQMAGAGGLIALLLNVSSKWGQAILIAVVGMMMGHPAAPFAPYRRTTYSSPVQG